MHGISRRGLLTGAVATGATMVGPLGWTSPARSAAPSVGKQAPGFYRYKVGSFEVTVVTDGMNTNPLSDAYVANQPKPAVNAALEADFLQKDKVSHAYTPIVVNTGTKLVAIDTGLGLGMFAQSKGEVGQYHNNLAGRRHRPQCGRHRDHFAFSWRSHQRPGRTRQQAGVPECRGDGARGRVGILGGREQYEQAARDRAGTNGQREARVRRARQQGHALRLGQGAGAGYHLGCELRPHAGSQLACDRLGQQQGPRAGRYHGGRGEPLHAQSGMGVCVRHRQSVGGADAQETLRHGRG